MMDVEYINLGENEEKKFEIVPFRPYFYVKEDSPEPFEYKPSKYVSREFEYIRGNWHNLNGEKLAKVIVESSHDIRAKDMFKETYEADVPYHFRYAVDCIDNMPEYKMRKWYWDMEWQQGGDYHDQLTTIVYDNYDEEYLQWSWFPNEFEENRINVDIWNAIQEEAGKFVHSVVFETEKDMIEHFLKEMIIYDPDMLIAWFGHFADLPKLFERACALGIDLALFHQRQPLRVLNLQKMVEFICGERLFSN